MILTSSWTVRVSWLALGVLVGCETDQRLGTIHSGAAGETQVLVGTGGRVGNGGAASGGHDTVGGAVGGGGQANTTTLAVGGQNNGGSTTTPIADLVLCNGSPDIRLGVTDGGGMVEMSYFFVHPYGYSFLFIDGLCRYWISRDSGELRQGVLSAADALDVEARVAYDRLAELEGDDASCPDAGRTTIQNPSHSASCSCGCDTEAKTVVFTQLETLKTELWNKAQAQDWSLSAARTDFVNTAVTVSWPLSWPVTDLPILDLSGVKASAGMLIEDVNDRVKLRALRTETQQRWPGAEVISLATDPSPALGIVLHEELPTEIRGRVEQFLGLTQ